MYGFVFIICIPIGAMYIIFINRSRFTTRKVQAAFGFLFEGYRPKMFFWEFVVMLRKVVVLGVALFWEDAFLQSITALFVLVVSIIIHMACWPYEELFLNVAELCSLLCLFTLVAFAVLLWYVQQPGKTDHLLAYELIVSTIIFLAYGGLLVALFFRIIYLEIRERSKVLVEKIPGLLPLFQWFVKSEEWLHFNLTKQELQGQDEMWGFLRKVRIVGEVAASDGINETKGEKAKRLLGRMRRKKRDSHFDSQVPSDPMSGEGGLCSAPAWGDAFLAERRMTHHHVVLNPLGNFLNEREGTGDDDEGSTEFTPPPLEQLGGIAAAPAVRVLKRRGRIDPAQELNQDVELEELETNMEYCEEADGTMAWRSVVSL